MKARLCVEECMKAVYTEFANCKLPLATFSMYVKPYD